MSASALRFEITPIEGGESVELVAGMVEGRQWERLNGRSVAAAIEESPTVIVELAHLAYRRRRHVDLSLEEFEERFDVDLANGQGGSVPADPSDPATAPSSG